MVTSRPRPLTRYLMLLWPDTRVITTLWNTDSQILLTWSSGNQEVDGGYRTGEKPSLPTGPQEGRRDTGPRCLDLLWQATGNYYRPMSPGAVRTLVFQEDQYHQHKRRRLSKPTGFQWLRFGIFQLLSPSVTATNLRGWCQNHYVTTVATKAQKAYLICWVTYVMRGTGRLSVPDSQVLVSRISLLYRVD